jgi:hypothetical protein
MKIRCKKITVKTVVPNHFPHVCIEKIKRKSTIPRQSTTSFCNETHPFEQSDQNRKRNLASGREREREMLFQVGGQGTRPTFFEMAAAQQLPASLRAALTYSIGVCGFNLWISLVSLGIRSFWDPLKFREFFFFFFFGFLSFWRTSRHILCSNPAESTSQMLVILFLRLSIW